MNSMTDMFDFSKSMESFSKFYPDFATAAPLKSVTDMATKCRTVAAEAMNKNVELTTTWMQDAAKDASALMTLTAEPTEYAKKAGEVATSAFQELPSRMFAFAEVAKKAQADFFDTVMAATPKTVEEVAARTKTAAKTTKKAA